MDQNIDHFMLTGGPLSGQKIDLSNLRPGEAGWVIGRMTPADLLLDGESVSRRHARISLGESGYIIEDLGSSNGTFVNDERIQTPRLLRAGDRVKIGPHEITLFIAPPAPAPTPVEVSSPGRGATERLEATNSLGKTIALDELPPPPPPLPPQLVVTASGQEPVVYTLTAPRMRIGRLPDNDIVIQNRYVSRYHAELEQRGADYYLIPSATISNPLLLDGKPVMEATRLHHGAKIRVGGLAPGELVSLDYLSPFGEAEAAAQQTIQFVDNRVMTIGRGPDNDITLPAPMVSRYHAEVEKIGQRYRVRDLRSSNGTFVNGKSIDGETWVQAGDTIQVGPYRFVVGEARLSQFDESGQGVRVEAFGLNKWVSKKLNIIQDISLVFQPREFIVVVGQSGGGKSSLVDAIAGYRPATHGKVMINDTIDVYREFDAIRNTIGYVPQKDIIHM